MVLVDSSLRGFIWRFGWVSHCRSYSVIVRPPHNGVREFEQSLTLYSHRFPDDLDTNALITHLRSLGTSGSSGPIKIGIYYKNERVRVSSRILECLVADPLALNSSQWFLALADRQKDKPITIKYGDFSGSTSGNTLHVPSPILSAQLRPQFPGIIDDQSPAVSLEIHEIQNIFSEWSLMHYTLGITDEPNGMMGLIPSTIKNQIAVTVIDNLDYTPQSIETTPVTFDIHLASGVSIKINSTTAYEGLEKFYLGGVQAARDMVHMWRESNICELLKAVVWALDPQNLKRWTLSNISRRIQSCQVEQQQLLDQQKQSEDLISQFGQASHEELQLYLVPRTKQFFEKKLSWWRLYILNDNVEYELKDFFSREFMPLSIEKYNYQRGSLNMIESRPNPLLELKTQLVTQKIQSQVQPVVTRVLTQAFIFYQLPLTLLGFASYQWFDFSANTAIALVLLGLTAGFNFVSRSWVAFLKEWTRGLFDQTRVCIDRDCLNNGLLADFKAKHATEWQDYEIRDKVAQAIDKYTGNK